MVLVLPHPNKNFQLIADVLMPQHSQLIQVEYRWRCSANRSGDSILSFTRAEMSLGVLGGRFDLPAKRVTRLAWQEVVRDAEDDLAQALSG